MNDARRLRRRAAQVRFEASAASPSPAAPQRRRHCGSSVTRRNAGTATQSSRQARWRVSALAAGIVAASMARRCQDKLKNTGPVFVPSARPSPARDGGGLFRARLRKELARRAKGGHEPGRVPHRPLLRPSRHATTHNPKRIQRAEARRSRCADVPRFRDKVPSRPSVPSTNVTCSVKRSRVPSGSPMNSTVATDTEWCRPFRCMS